MVEQQSQPEIRTCRTCGKELTDWHKKFCDDDCYAAYTGPAQVEPVPKTLKEPEIRRCIACGKVLTNWRRKVCSDACIQPDPPKPPKPPKRKSLADAPSGVGSIGQPENGEPAKPKSKGGPPNKKRSDELLAAILNDMAQYNLTEAQAAAGHNVRPETFSRWKNEPECEGLRERAQCISIKTLFAKFENAPPGEWKKYAWMLERFFRTQFGDPAKVAVQLNQQFIGENGDLVSNQAEAEEARQRLDHTIALEKKRKAGVATDAELREIMVEEIAERQRVVDYIDGGGTLDQEEQKQLYHQLEDESDNRRQEPIPTAVGHVVGEGRPLAIEDSGTAERALGPKRPQPPQDMRASETDPLSGVAKSAEPPTPWRDRKPPTGPLSERQRQRLAQERERRGSEGKSPW